MASEAPVMNNEVFNHFLTGMTPAEIAEHLKDIYPEFGDLNTEELLLMQESAFQYIQNNNQNRDTTSSNGETSNDSLVLGRENEPSHEASVEDQLALDEALARALELGDDFNNLYVHDDGVNTVDNTRSTIQGTSSRGESQSIRQDDIDPDRMTYEVLYELNCNHSVSPLESREEDFQQMSSHGYQHPDTKRACSQRKRKRKKRCVICCDGYKNGAKLTTLPCAHQYHSHCITPWLLDNKQCPICQNEVEDE